MSRSSWKYIYHTDYDLEVFYSSIDNSFSLSSNNRRSLTINRLNYTQNHYVYQGKYNVYFDTSIYCLNYKLGMFTKTRKPFFFRSKKKKKIIKLLWRKLINLLKINRYINFNNKINYNFLLLKLINNLLSTNVKLSYYLIEKYDKKPKSLKKDWNITQKYFYFFVNINWEDLFSFFIFLTNYTKISFINYIYNSTLIITIIFNSLYNLIEDIYSLLYNKIKFNDFNKISNFLKITHSINQNIFNFNLKLTLNSLIISFLKKTIHNSFEFLDINWLCFWYISVPYYYLDHWFHIQLESWIIYVKVLLIKHYSNNKIIAYLSKKNYSFVHKCNTIYINIKNKKIK